MRLNKSKIQMKNLQHFKIFPYKNKVILGTIRAQNHNVNGKQKNKKCSKFMS